MFLDDTIVAISTPPGEGGIGIVRLTGKDAIKIADRLFHSSIVSLVVPGVSVTIALSF